MPPTPIQQSAAGGPNTPEFSEEAESDEHRTEEVEGLEEGDEVDDEEEEEEEEFDPFRDDDPTLHGLRNINALASFHVSTHKPTCGVPALLNPTPHTFWQSDGPQPHTLTIHFFKLVHIRKFRLLLDWKRDESYTPTRMQFLAGTGHHDLVEFGHWEGERPRGWVDVGLAGQGVGGGDGVRAMVVQVRVLENHQNGKDTHVRGVQVFGRDERVGGVREEVEVDVEAMKGRKGMGMGKGVFDLKGLGDGDEPDWMKDPVIR